MKYLIVLILLISTTCMAGLKGVATPLNQGGTGSRLTAVPGGVVYSGSTGMAISAVGTTGQVLKSNGGAAPTWINFSGSTNGSQTLNDTEIVSSSYNYLKLSSGNANFAGTFAENTSGSSGFIQASLPSDNLGQSFTSLGSANITSIMFQLQISGGTFSGNMVVDLYGDSGGTLTPLIVTSSPVDSATLTTSFAPVTFTVASTPLVGGATYYAVVNFSGVTFGGGETINFYSSNANPYAGGSAGTGTLSTAWNDFGGSYDTVFSVTGPPFVGPGNVSTDASTPISNGSSIGQALLIQEVGPNNVTVHSSGNTVLKSNSDVILFPNDTLQVIWDGTSKWTQTGGSVNH